MAFIYHFLSLVLGAIFMVGVPLAAKAEEKPPQETLVQADKVIYDDRTRKVRIIGTPQQPASVFYQGTHLVARELIYNLDSGTLVAKGDIVLKQPGNEVISSDYMEFTDDFADGVGKNFLLLMQDNTRVASPYAVRVKGKFIRMNNVTYTSCILCENKQGSSPLWQLRARRAYHNADEKNMIFEDSFIEFFGVPVFYIPYLTQPDPSVKRRSGFLMPKYAQSSSMGLDFEIPYFMALASNYDLTLRPRYIDKGGFVAAMDWRHLISPDSKYQASISMTWPSGKQKAFSYNRTYNFRGSLFAKGDFRLTSNWKTGFDIKTATDDDYTRQYKIDAATSTLSQVYAQYLSPSTFFDSGVYMYSMFNSKSEKYATPYTLPFLHYQKLLTENLYGGRVDITLNAAHTVHRHNRGARVQKISMQGRWQTTQLAPYGIKIHYALAARADNYTTSHVKKDPTPFSADVNTTLNTDERFPRKNFYRFHPTFTTTFSWPLLAMRSTGYSMIDPTVQVILSPYKKPVPQLPNEDSQSVNFDFANIFAVNRYTGQDLYESGNQLRVGVQFSHHDTQGRRRFAAMLGQSFRAKEQAEPNLTSGFAKKTSNYVGEIFIQPWLPLTLTDKFQISQNERKFIHHEIQARFTWDKYTFHSDYTFLDAHLSHKGEKQEAITSGLSMKITPYWRAYGSVRYDIALAQKLENKIALRYNDECFTFDVSFTQTETRNSAIRPDNSIKFVFALKPLGQFGSSDFE